MSATDSAPLEPARKPFNASDTGFTHLHLHTQYSLLDGAIRMDELCPEIKSKGMNTVAVTDHGNMFGAVHLANQAKRHGVKPIFGIEAYIAGDKGRKDRTDRKSSHLVLLAKDHEGYKNLRYIVSMSYMEGFYYRPRIDQELLRKHSKGIIGLSACLGGVVAKKFLNEGEAAAAEAAKTYAALFEKDSFFLEIQDNGLEPQERANKAILNISELYNIPLVATADAHYRRPEDSAAHEVLMCIGQGMTLEEFRQKSFKHSDMTYVREPQSMWDAFGRLAPEAVENTNRIARACNVELDLSQIYLPTFGVPEGYTLNTFLEKVAFDGLKARIEEATYPIDRAAYKQRLEYELGVILRMEFPGYFLIVWDFIRFAKKQQIPVGPGRGSGAGSLVAYCLRITDLDPIPYDLIFERFLNPERVSMPDFDIDFCMDRRGEVIDYVTQHYGKQNVAQIVTYSALSAKSGIKDVGRVMGLPFAEVNELTKLIPGLVDGRKVTIDQALKIEPRLKEIQEEKPIYRDVINISRGLEGLNRQTGIHAAGIVIGEKPIWDYVPVLRGKEGEMVTQFAKDEVEQAGLVKFDFLGLKTLTVVDNAVRHIRARSDDGPIGPNKSFDIARIGLDDEQVYALIARADTDGVFQLESSGFKDLLKRLRPDGFEDIVAAVALYRPGPLDAGMVDDYVDRKHGRKKIEYPHAVCEPILGTTYGVIVYQEQVMRIAVDLCGFTMGEADVLRKAMGKKKADVMAKMRAQFVDGAFDNNGMPKNLADTLFTQIEKFAGYAFNKSHSAAYAVISYQTAFLKHYYPVEFMAALMSTEMKTQENVVRYLQSASEHGIRILPPDVQRSFRDFSVVSEDDGAQAILFGLGAVKGIGDSVIDALLEAREREIKGTEPNSPFSSLYGLCEAVDPKKLNRRALETLVKGGACDSFQKPRAQLFGAVERALDAGQRAHRDRMSGQTSLFDAFAAAPEPGPTVQAGAWYPDIDEWSEKARLANEKEALGFYITGHPLDRYVEDLPRLTTHRTCDLLDALQDRETRFADIRIGGIISAYRERPLKNGKGRMAFVTLEDKHGSVECLVFSKAFALSEHVLRSDDPVLLVGKVMNDGDSDDNEPTSIKLRVAEALSLASERASKTQHLTIRLPSRSTTDAQLQSLKTLLARHHGDVAVRLVITDPELTSTDVHIDLPPQLRSNTDDELLGGIERLFGERVVCLS